MQPISPQRRPAQAFRPASPAVRFGNNKPPAQEEAAIRQVLKTLTSQLADLTLQSLPDTWVQSRKPFLEITIQQTMFEHRGIRYFLQQQRSPDGGYTLQLLPLDRYPNGTKHTASLDITHLTHRPQATIEWQEQGAPEQRRLQGASPELEQEILAFFDRLAQIFSPLPDRPYGPGRVPKPGVSPDSERLGHR